MTRNEKLDIRFHLWIITVFFIIVMGSCSTLFYYANPGGQDRNGLRRYDISENDLNQFSTKLRPHRQDPQVLYQQACYMQEAKKHALAIEVLEDAIVSDPLFAKAYNALGVSFDYLGDYPRAIEAYKRALKISPDLDYVHNNLGYSHLLQGDTDSAIEAFKSAISLSQGNPKYHNNLALAYAQHGLFDLAFAEFLKAGSEAKAHYNMAQFYYQKGKFEKAEAHFARALEIAPEAYPAKLGLQAASAMAEIAGPGDKLASDDIDTQTPALIEIDANGKKTLRFSIRPKTTHRAAISIMGAEVSSEILKPQTKTNEVAVVKKVQKVADDIEIEISNGNGMNRMARRVGNYLSTKGLKVTRLTNAKHFGFAETTIYYQDHYLHDAFDVAKQIPGYQQMEKIEAFGQQRIKIKVLIGKDIVPYDKLFRISPKRS
jgi:tetratricopeptide (TPR) repeat protein